jgi:uncharacterized protein YjgD (DUF1641 family)
MKKYKNMSDRFEKIAQLLFTSKISDEEHNTAEKVVDILDKAKVDLERWLETIENNLEVLSDPKFATDENSLVMMTEKYEDVNKTQKEKYERILQSIKQAIDIMGTIQDVEIQDMIVNFTKASEEFTTIYNELTDLPTKIGEEGFIKKFKDASSKILANDEPFLEVIQRVRDYIMKNIMGEQSLS